MRLSAAHQGRGAGAAGLVASVALLTSCMPSETASKSVGAAGDAKAAAANPLLRQFMGICSQALNDVKAARQLVLENGWQVFGPDGASSRIFQIGGGLSGGGFELAMFSTPESDPMASECAVRGMFVSPAYADGFATFEVPRYSATNETFPSGMRRRLEGTASFGDPILIELLVSSAQGGAVVELTMTNLAKAPRPKPN